MVLDEAGDGEAVVAVVAAVELDGGVFGEGEVCDEVFINQVCHEVVDAKGAGVEAVVDVEEEDGAHVYGGV